MRDLIEYAAKVREHEMRSHPDGKEATDWIDAHTDYNN